ncbi:MAG: hypothetical protein QGI18_03660 [Candidatus Marinimicrobia bacterium]|nr:hypothetical protein [Candidatus Neomarinimicrobiota bacterium]
MQAFLIRRFWLLRQRLISSAGLVLVLPIIVFLTVSIGMKNVIMETMGNISYNEWVYPGLIMLINTIIITPIIFRDFHFMRLESQTLVTLSLSPLSKLQIVCYLIFAAIIEGIILSMVSIFILLYLMEISLAVSSLIYIIISVSLFSLIIANAFTTLSLSTHRINHIFVGASIISLFIIYSSQLLIEFDFYPKSLIDIFKFFPTSMISNWYRLMVFKGEFNFDLFFIPLITGILWIFLNSFLMKRVLKQ